ncbi:unnamed protein product [Owenia fusiformis]|uniref:Uncharacterized protein n=1 Tax=Owenia fusiformis TaxID=6347 RepID=A0A8J1TFR7_OWEFU|nr:unnamed protein product [Owenia fusiformis]
MRIAVIILIATCIAATQACNRGRHDNNKPEPNKPDSTDENTPERPSGENRPDRPRGDSLNSRTPDTEVGDDDRIKYGLVGRPHPRFPPKHRHGNHTDGPHHNGTRPHHNETSHEHPHKPHHNHSDSGSSSHEGRRPHHPRRRGPKRHSSESQSSESQEDDVESSGTDIEKPEIEPEVPIDGDNPEKPIEGGSGDGEEQGFLP